MVVLDEPNSNLDPLGEQSLNQAIQRIRGQGKIVVIVAHRPSAIFAANKILSLRNGRAEMFGPKKQVLAALFPRLGQPHKPHSVTDSDGATPANETAPAETGTDASAGETGSDEREEEANAQGAMGQNNAIGAGTNVTPLDVTRSCQLSG